jgi:excisionase family DNA binding protein
MHTQTPATSSESAEYLSLPAVARRLGISEDTVRRRIKSGGLRAVLVAGRYRIRPDDADALITPSRGGA